MFSFYFNYKSSLKEHLTVLKLTEQQLTAKKEIADQLTITPTNWSNLLGEIPLDMETINISTIMKNANGLMIAGQALNFLAVAELANLINGSEFINLVRIDNIEKTKEDESINFKISILLTQEGN